MKRNIIIADDFYAEPDAVARYAMTQNYCTPYNKSPNNPNTILWRTSRFKEATQCPFKSSEALIAKLEFLTGERIDLKKWQLSFPTDALGLPAPGYEKQPRSAWWNCAFHVKHHPQELGEAVHNHTEGDPWNAAGADGWAGIIYLNKHAPHNTGLFTWQNKSGNNEERFTPKENWQLVDSYANVYNRLILHRGSVPHSGAAGWGSEITDGRLYQTFFFSTLETMTAAPLENRELGLT
jgi:hypothetical protein